MKVPESKKTVPKERQDEDMKFCHEVHGIPKKSIESCHRAGKIKVSSADSKFNRSLIIKMKDEKDRKYWSNNEKGFLVPDTTY